MITRDDLIDFQTETIENYVIFIKVYFSTITILNKLKKIMKSLLIIQNMLSSLDSSIVLTVFASGAMSAKQYVNELWETH